jgi:hypothetical protein
VFVLAPARIDPIVEIGYRDRMTSTTPLSNVSLSQLRQAVVLKEQISRLESQLANLLDHPSAGESLPGMPRDQASRFRAAVQALSIRAEAAANLSANSVEYGHQVALLWSDIGRLGEFIGASPAISEIVAELRTARFQSIGKDTPPARLHAAASALRHVADAKDLDSATVDRMVEILEDGGFDSMAPDALRDTRA